MRFLRGKPTTHAAKAARFNQHTRPPGRSRHQAARKTVTNPFPLCDARSPLFRDLIRAVRSCKTAAQEREVIAKESAELREAFREQVGFW